MPCESNQRFAIRQSPHHVVAYILIFSPVCGYCVVVSKVDSSLRSQIGTAAMTAPLSTLCGKICVSVIRNKRPRQNIPFMSSSFSRDQCRLINAFEHEVEEAFAASGDKAGVTR